MGPSGVPLPMLAVPGPVPGGEGWAFEFKWDGLRAVVEISSTTVRVFSSGGRDITAGFPELGGPDGLGELSNSATRGSLVLDGEIVALDIGQLPSPDLLRCRTRTRTPGEDVLACVPVRFYAFDVLAIDGGDTTHLPYGRRRAILDALGLAGPVGHVPPYLTGQGSDVLDAARESGIDGVIAKRMDSLYHPGRRSREWITTSLVPTREAIVVGWKPGQGRLAGHIGALILAGHDRYARLNWLGNVGTGFSTAALLELAERLHPLARPGSPLYRPMPWAAARDVRWVEPELVGEVAYHTVTSDGRLRDTAWRGVRSDRKPIDVTMPG